MPGYGIKIVLKSKHLSFFYTFWNIFLSFVHCDGSTFVLVDKIADDKWIAERNLFCAIKYYNVLFSLTCKILKLLKLEIATEKSRENFKNKTLDDRNVFFPGMFSRVNKYSGSMWQTYKTHIYSAVIVGKKDLEDINSCSKMHDVKKCFVRNLKGDSG